MILDPLGMALAIMPLLERGSEALKTRYASIPKKDRPIGLSIAVVTEEDFVRNSRLILRHVCASGTSTHILCESGVLCLLIERLPEG